VQKVGNFMGIMLVESPASLNILSLWSSLLFRGLSFGLSSSVSGLKFEEDRPANSSWRRGLHQLLYHAKLVSSAARTQGCSYLTNERLPSSRTGNGTFLREVAQSSVNMKVWVVNWISNRSYVTQTLFHSRCRTSTSGAMCTQLSTLFST
jgi:hypothetical protein